MYAEGMLDQHMEFLFKASGAIRGKYKQKKIVKGHVKIIMGKGVFFVHCLTKKVKIVQIIGTQEG